MRRVAVLFASQVLLWTLVGQLNHLLTDLRLYVFAGVLYVAYAALRQTWRVGLAVSILGGFLCDASAPVTFGTHAMLFAAAHLAVYEYRERLPRGDTAAQVVIVLLVNLGLFVAFASTQAADAPRAGAMWSRLAMDLLASEVFVALVTPWFFALQAGALALARAERENFA